MDFHKVFTFTTVILPCFMFVTPITSLRTALAGNLHETDKQKDMQKLQDTPDKVQLTIDVSRDKKKISKYLYGINIANWCPTYYLDLCAPRLRSAKVTVVRLGATNMERYNFKNNRMFNVIKRRNEYVAMSWESFVEWCKRDIKAEPFLQVSVYGHVAGSGDTIDDPDYDHIQSIDEVERWIAKAGQRVRFWGIGNEPWIAWKREDYPDPYGDAAHGLTGIPLTIVILVVSYRWHIQ